MGEIRIHLTEKGKIKAETYINELIAKKKEILDAKLDTDYCTHIPSINDIEVSISCACKDFNFKEYRETYEVTDKYNADKPLVLEVDEDFTLHPLLGDFYKWNWHVFSEDEGVQEDDSNDWAIDVEGVGTISNTEMTLSPDVADDECMRVSIDGRYYYFG
ncbi:hypothetical protein [Butyrivibrio hungatei]|uniref:Uncharacterized protein n=1 Tax=Butyrivibrio hungatei TaxID=185008 RepID=A0A1D9P5S6_9FIRM|nr:hypothetical protein [Butyrivibrio hungatei]AOZ97920.1 hypothetical protein bhn_II121 [Butyrivibrio hungatei]